LIALYKNIFLKALMFLGHLINQKLYFNQLELGKIGLLIVYAKSKLDNLPAEFFAQLKEELNHD